MLYATDIIRVDFNPLFTLSGWLAPIFWPVKPDNAEENANDGVLAKESMRKAAV